MTLNRKERAAAFKHAKDHAIEALTDMMSDEHHSAIKVGEKDAHSEVMGHLERMLRLVRRESFQAYENRRAFKRKHGFRSTHGAPP